MRKLTIGLQSPEGHSQIRARQPPNSLLQALLCLLPASLLLHSSSSYLALWAFKCETRVLHPAEVKPTHTPRTSNLGRHRQWSTGFFPAESSPHCGAEMGRIKLKRALPWRPFLGCENSPVLQASGRDEQVPCQIGRIWKGLPLRESFRSQSWARRIGKNKHLKKALLVR